MEAKNIGTSKNKHPKDRANFLSHFLFCWQLSVLIKGWRKTLTRDSIQQNIKEHESGKLGAQLSTFWFEEENLQKAPSLTRALTKSFGLQFLLYGLLFFPIEVGVILLQPFLLKKLLDSLSDEVPQLKEKIFFGSMIVLCSLLRVLTSHFFFLQCSAFGIKVRTACCSLIFRKMLNLKKSSTQQITVGQIINLLSNDVERFDKVFAYLHFLWIVPIKLVVVTWYLFALFDYSALTGMAVPLLYFFIQMFILNKIAVIRRDAASKTDYRIRLISDIVNGIQTIKMYTWEKCFERLVQSSRKSELKLITQANSYRNNSYTLTFYSTRVCLFLCILVAVLSGTTVTSQYVFTLANIYELVQISSHHTNSAVIFLSEVRVSIRRIQDFLLREVQIPHKKQNTEGGVCAQNVSTKWDSSANYILRGVNIDASPSELVAIVGSTGCGKTTFLQAVLEELDLVEGSVSVGGTISYAPQEPWIFSASVKDNILFGDELDDDKYRGVLRVCALSHDISLFPYGDNTLVGERGTMLSGGQKARISLARAIYKQADVYLLDDPLSAVDMHVAAHIFKECILERLKYKCVILVTHQIQYLKDVPKIYFLEKGKVTAARNYNDVEKVKLETNCVQTLINEKYHSPCPVNEDEGSGTVNPYQSYCFVAKKYIAFGLISVLFVAAQFFLSGFDLFLAFWINLKQASTVKYLSVAGTILAASIVLCHLNTWLFVRFCQSTSRHLHDLLFRKVLSGSMQFFSDHSSGRILNRLSHDVGVIDDFIPMTLGEGIRQFGTVLAGTVVIMILNYWMVLPALVLYVLVYCYIQAFQPVVSHFKKIEATRRSPIFSHVAASFKGLSVIRAFKRQNQAQEEFDNLQNLHGSVCYLHRALYYALAFWTDITTFLYSAVVIFSLLILENGAYSGNVGLGITQSLMLVTLIQYLTKLWGDLDTQMTSVERVVEYTDLTPEEDFGTLIPSKWVKEGKIVFDSVSMRYSIDKPLVLRNINFTIQSGEKIGIVGRTGSGKSSLISVLFRLVSFTGTVYIDGVDTKSTPLSAMRSKIAIIPQDPVLFLGSLRKNLDPFDAFTDSQLWHALEDVELKNLVSDLPSGLNSEVSEGGSNFSVGQRQLFCLVRAILKKSKIVVLDEATASIDLKTDELIQRNLRLKFGGATVLTIAHRLSTVLDSDKILVLDCGKVVDYGGVDELLANSDGMFYKYFYNA